MRRLRQYLPAVGALRALQTRRSTVVFSCSCYLHGCRCGFYGDATRECRCTPAQIQQYLGKISGPLLDRIDIHVEVPAVPYKELRGDAQTESSAEMRARVERARAIQQARGFYNARMPSRLIRKQCVLDDSGERTLEMAVRRMGLSARARPGLEGRANGGGFGGIGDGRCQARGGGGAVSQSGSELLELKRVVSFGHDCS